MKVFSLATHPRKMSFLSCQMIKTDTQILIITHQSLPLIKDLTLMLLMKSQHQQIPIYTATRKFGRNYDREMSQCFLCMLWFHTECTDSINIQSIWACNNCRCLPQTVVSLKQQLFELHNIMSNILNNQNEFYSNICQVSLKMKS